MGFEDAIEEYHAAAAEFIRGDPERYERLFSHRDDVTLANPFGPPARGWENVRATMDRAATLYADGRILAFENVATLVTSELAYIVEIERFEARVGGTEELASLALRTTSVLRPEDSGWKVVHRHADTITTPREAGSIVPSDAVG
ncbi:MAG TPA: nuclear transport factor 2 family protein [Actinomycetota bacterium]|jgi:ketosteroid isomerase-like protein